MPKQPYGFQEWIEKKNRVNICIGCYNDCIYCYAKLYGYHPEGRWTDMTINQKKVDKGWRKSEGRKGFPTSHDITPEIIDEYIEVLGKLLNVGNEVLIVSKPRMECIVRICETADAYKDKILFRFTIGAMDDETLSYWEPNAPSYQERRDALEYAFENGFNTSVSVEPMLDSPNIEMLVEDLEPYVNDAIWIGKMEHIKEIKENADERLIKKLEQIELYQRDEMIRAMYETYRDNPKIKWKSSIKKIVEGTAGRPCVYAFLAISRLRHESSAIAGCFCLRQDDAEPFDESFPVLVVFKYPPPFYPTTKKGVQSSLRLTFIHFSAAFLMF